MPFVAEGGSEVIDDVCAFQFNHQLLYRVSGWLAALSHAVPSRVFGLLARDNSDVFAELGSYKVEHEVQIKVLLFSLVDCGLHRGGVLEYYLFSAPHPV